MLRITRLTDETSHIVLRLEGQITLHWVDELRHQISNCRRTARCVTLDLADVNFAGPSGVQLLKQLVSEGVRLVHCPALLQDLLE